MPVRASSVFLTAVLTASTLGMLATERATGEQDPASKAASGNLVRHSIGEKAGDERSDNGLRMKFCWCPPGSFTMGSPADEPGRKDDEAQVNVTFKHGFWLGKTEVTQGEWSKVMETTPWSGKTYVKEGTNYPATYFSWEDVNAFCTKLTQQEQSAGRLPRGWRYDLPREAEWEYACRAGTSTRFSFGDDESRLGEYAWFDKNAWDVGEKYAHEVGAKKANPWGLHDMHGNVWELCRDWYASNLPGGPDPEVIAPAPPKVFRGGSWGWLESHCRSAFRGGWLPGPRGSSLGFRVALVQSR